MTTTAIGEQQLIEMGKAAQVASRELSRQSTQARNQALINIGGISRAIPMAGIPMPFLSYGGSALAGLLAAVGILLSISRQANAPPTVVCAGGALRPSGVRR